MTFGFLTLSVFKVEVYYVMYYGCAHASFYKLSVVTMYPHAAVWRKFSAESSNL